MPYIVCRPISTATVRVPTPEGEINCSVQDLQWVGVCPMVISYTEALELTNDPAQIIEVEFCPVQKQ